MINELKLDCESRMKKKVEALRHEFTKIRTGRASPGLLDHVVVDYYGTPTPINQVANITVSDARTLTITPWEQKILAAIEKAILTSDLGLNPSSVGNIIRVPMPALTEERRKEMIKVVRSEAEQGKVGVRTIRRDILADLKDQLKSKVISEDDERRASDLVQKITDKYVAEMDAELQLKEKDLMEV